MGVSSEGLRGISGGCHEKKSLFGWGRGAAGAVRARIIPDAVDDGIVDGGGLREHRSPDGEEGRDPALVEHPVVVDDQVGRPGDEPQGDRHQGDLHLIMCLLRVVAY